MVTNGKVGAVARLWRFPVKSMRGERLEQAELTEHGLVGDRAYALIDANTGKVVSAKSAGLYPAYSAVGQLSSSRHDRVANCHQCGSRCRTARRRPATPVTSTACCQRTSDETSVG